MLKHRMFSRDRGRVFVTYLRSRSGLAVFFAAFVLICGASGAVGASAVDKRPDIYGVQFYDEWGDSSNYNAPPAVNVMPTTAEIRAQITLHNLDTQWEVDYGTTEDLGSVVGGSLVYNDTGNGADIAVTLSGLEPSTTYYYRVKATNSAGTRTGSTTSSETLWSFDTLPPATSGSLPAPTIGGMDSGGGAVPGTSLYVDWAPLGDSPYVFGITSYRVHWQRCSLSGSSCSAITGATGTRYDPHDYYMTTKADIGHTLRAVVTISRYHVLSALTSATTEPVTHGVSLSQTLGTGSSRHTKKIDRKVADPVASSSGNFVYEATDLSFAGPGISFSLTRTYNSLDSGSTGGFGSGWSSSQGVSLRYASGDGSAFDFVGEDGQTLRYLGNADGSFETPDGARATLEQTPAGGHILRDADQTTYTFDGSGRVVSIKDRNDQGLTYTYSDETGLLQTVTDAAGRSFDFVYDDNYVLTSVSAPDGTSVSYGYTDGRLTSVTDAGGAIWNYQYDTVTTGLLASATDPLGHSIFSNIYGDDLRVASQTDGRGKTTTFAWDPATETATATDPAGHEWTDVYDHNVLKSETDPLGHETQYQYSDALDRTAVGSPDGSVTTMTYDANGNVLTATAPASLGSAQKTFSYDAQNNVTSVTDPKGNATLYTYDTNGNLTAVELNSVQTAAYTYNPAGQRLTSTDGNNHTTTYTYDSNGNVASVTDPLGNQTTYTYDDDGHVLSKVDPLGNATGATPVDYTTTYIYDLAGNLLTETDPLGHTTTKTYDAAGRLLTTTDPNSHTTTNTYDGNANLLSVTSADPDGVGPLLAPVTSYTYDDAGNKLTETDPNNHTTTFIYDASNRLLSETTAGGNKTTYSYDANGNRASLTDPRGNILGANPADYTTTYTYDAAGRKLTSTDPLGHVTTYTYDAVGNCSSVTDANNHMTSYTYDAAGLVLTVTAPDGGVTTYSYDGNNHVLTHTDDNNHVTNYVYDDAGRLIQETAPDPDGTGPLSGAVTTKTYDANGNLLTTVDPNGNATTIIGDGTTTRSYDRTNRLTGIDYSGSAPDVTFSYDAVGNRTGMTDGAGSITYILDNLNRLTSVTRGSDTFTYSYDADANLLSRTYPGSLTTSYTYNNEEHVATAVTANGTTSYDYDAAGNLTQTTLPSANGYAESRTYDKAGRLVDVKNEAGSSVLSEFATTLDAVGNPNRIDRSGETSSTTTYTYDASDRLTSVCFQASCPNGSDPSVAWTYDKVGNRLSETRPSGTVTYTYNAADELTAAGATTYSYDANGNQLSDAANTYTYDLSNRMTAASDSSGTTNYSYDGDGNRLQASDGTGVAGTTNYLWDTNASGGIPQIAVERDGSGAVTRSYAYGANRLAMNTGAGTFYYHYDLIGSVANLTASLGSSEWTYEYDPFGATRVATKNDPNAPANSMQFAGEYVDTTGLYNLRARQYDPTIGRMLAVDPLPMSVGDAATSSFAYVADRPTVMVDPSGQTAQPSNNGKGAAAGVTSTGLGGCLLPVWWNVCADPPLLKPVIKLLISTSGVTLPLAAGAVATFACGPCGIYVTIVVAAAASGTTKAVVTKYVQGKSTTTAVDAGAIEFLQVATTRYLLNSATKELARFLLREQVRNAIKIDIWSKTVVKHISIP
jgi:RHS repeat-associated protein